MRRNEDHWQRWLTKTISTGSHNLIKYDDDDDDDDVLTKYSTANRGRRFAANQGIEGIIKYLQPWMH